MNLPVKLAILCSHPIPYHSPFFRGLAVHKDLQIKVFYGDDYGVTPSNSAWGLKDFVWKTNILEGYPYTFLPNRARKTDPSTILGKINPGLIPAVLGFKPDAVLIMGYNGFFEWQGLAGALFARIPILFLGDNSVLKRQPTGLRGWLKPAILKRLYRSCSAFMVMGQRNRQHYMQYGVPETKMFRFSLAVDNEHFSREEIRLKSQRDSLRKDWCIPYDSICVVYSGRLSPEKNIPELIRGVSKVPNLHLLLVGDGPARSALELLARELIPSRHTFAGFLNQNELGKAYVAADFFSLTSFSEPWGLACNEALNFGLPLVVSDQIGSCADLVIPGETGYGYPVGDIEALARALEQAQDLVRSRRGEVADACKRLVASFSMEHQVQGTREALNAVLARPLAERGEQRSAI